MKAISNLELLKCFFLFCSLQQLSLAALTVKRNEDVAAVSFDIKRGADYRNALFGVYSCRVKKATDAVKSKLQVRLFWQFLYIFVC